MTENWFLSEPVYYAVYCTLRLMENDRIACSVRVGQGLLEYNPLLLSRKNYRETELLFRTEMIRVLMLHPYERRPDGVSERIISIGSDITLGDNYCYIRGKEKLPVQTPEAYHLPLGMPYEWYVEQLRRQDDKNDSDSSDSSDSDRSASDKSHLWEERELERERIRELIDRTSDWGSIPADLVERIRLHSRQCVNHRQVMDAFRASVLSEAVQLTRMRPNRRTGYQQMGRHRELMTNLLLCVDVSGSVTTDEIARAYALINRLFVYGVARIEVLTFDATIQSIALYRRTQQEVTIVGRGGTNYAPVLDYIAQQHYDGAIFITDGEAELPSSMPTYKPQRTKLLWLLTNQLQYNKHFVRLHDSGRVAVL